MGKETETLVPNLFIEFPGTGEQVLNDPNDWFQERFPELVKKYGPAVVVGKWIDQHGNVNVVPLSVNEDLFAGILGGDLRLGHRIVFLRQEDRWYFMDPLVDAYCPTNEEKLQLLLSNYLVRCAQACSRLVNVRPLMETFRAPKSLKAIISRAKAMVEADSSFFTGESGRRRCVDGEYIEPTAVKSHMLFVQAAIVPDPAASVTVPEAYHRYRVFCERNNLPAFKRSEFKAIVGEVIREQFQLGIRHDVDNGRGQLTHGWRGLSLVGTLDFTKN